MAQNVTVQGASYSNVPAVILPKTGGGSAKFTDVTPTTAVDSDVASGKIYFKADGTQSTGTASGVNIDTKTATLTGTPSNVVFNNLEAEPKAFFVRCASSTPSGTDSYYYIANIRYDGTGVEGNTWRRSTGRYYNNTSYYSYTYSNGTLTVKTSGTTSNQGGRFWGGTYELTYVY